MTIEQANHYFAALPDGFASTEQLRAAFTAPVQKVQFVGVAGTAGKTVTARLLAAILHARGIHAGLYHAGCRPLSERICIDDAPVDEGLLALTADALSAAEALPQDAAELAAAANCFGAAGCTLAVVELPDAGLAEALPGMPVCAVTSVGPDGVSRSVERLAALAAGVMRKGSICVTAPEQPKVCTQRADRGRRQVRLRAGGAGPGGYHLSGGRKVCQQGGLRRIYRAAGFSGPSCGGQRCHGCGAFAGAVPQGL